MYISAVLKQHGHTVRLVRCNKDKKEVLHEAIKQAEIVGVSLTSQVVVGAVDLVKDIRTISPRAKIIVGGPHAYLFENEVFKQLPQIDYACMCEGEYAMLELANGQSIEKIDGLLWRDGDVVHKNKQRDLIEPLDKLPMPDRDGIRLGNYTLPGSMLTSRGCPFRCAYCVRIFDRKYRAHSPEYVMNEMDTMYHKYSVRDFVMSDDNFAVDVNRAYKLADMIEKKNWKDITIGFGNGLRVDLIMRHPDLIKRYAGIGLKSVSLGVESVIEDVLDATMKDITRDQINGAISILKKHNINYFVYLQVGLPNDKYENLRTTKEWAKKEGITNFSSALTTPYPKTPLWEYVEKHGRFLYPKSEIHKHYPWHNLMNVFPVWDTKEFPAEKRMRALTELRYYAARRLVGSIGILAILRHPAFFEWFIKWLRYAVLGRMLRLKGRSPKP